MTDICTNSNSVDKKICAWSERQTFTTLKIYLEWICDHCNLPTTRSSASADYQSSEVGKSIFWSCPMVWPTSISNDVHLSSKCFQIQWVPLVCKWSSPLVFEVTHIPISQRAKRQSYTPTLPTKAPRIVLQQQQNIKQSAREFYELNLYHSISVE
jgi:hypothetical protein